MARTRQIKPEFWTDDDTATLEPCAKLLFIGMWGLADREGRLEDKPLSIQLRIIPREQVNADILLGELAARGLIQRYAVDGVRVIQIRSFKKHQHIHPNEARSELPAPPIQNHNDSNSSRHSITRNDIPGNSSECQPTSDLRLTTSDLSPPRVPARDPLWPAWGWFQRFKVLWPGAHGQIVYGDGDDDAKATGELDDKLNSLPGEARIAAQTRADELILGYFAIESARPAAHPWKWFVARFNELRVPKDARGSPGGKTRGKQADHEAMFDEGRAWAGK